jgi:predicted RNA-binding Zn-ribbon protein involved in translation (DUF1610 family)
VVDTMTHIPCRCGSKQEEILNYETRARVGWYCPKCGEFTRAIGRERKLEVVMIMRKRQNTRRNVGKN